MWQTAVFREGGRIQRLILTIYAVSFVSALIESVAGSAGRARLMDLTAVFIEQPFWLLLVCVWAIYVCSKALNFTLASALDRVCAYVPLALVVPMVNMIAVWLGFESIVPPFVNVLDLPVSLLTLGWWPRLVASPGILVALTLVAILFAVWAWNGSRRVSGIMTTVLFWLVGVFVFLWLPSFVAWAIVSTDVSPLNAGPNVLARSWVALSQEGYWWHAVTDRFPGVLEGEAESSVRFLRLSIAWLVVLLTTCVIAFRSSSRRWREWLRWFKPVRGVAFFLVACFGLWFGRVSGGVLFLRAIDLVALLLFVVMLCAVWGVSVWRNDLHDYEADAAQGRTDRPLVSGTLSEQEFTTLGKRMFFIAVVSGWLLGWPVIWPMLAFILLQELLARPGIRWKERLFGGSVLALSYIIVGVSGVFFSLRTAAVPILRPGLWLGLAVFVLCQAVPKMLRWSPEMLQKTSHLLRLPPRFLIPIALGLSYLTFPLFTGWMILWWIALPCAVVSLLPLLGTGRWDERKIVGWQVAFLFVAFLLLSVHPSP